MRPAGDCDGVSSDDVDLLAATPGRVRVAEPKTTRQLAMEGHWLLEGIDAEGYDVVVHKVPAALRFILLHGFGRAYRRQADARWTPDESPVTAAAP